MARRRLNTTKYEIIQQATKLFLEEGYSVTSPHMICDALDISTGNLTYYFPTKEHLLAVIVEMLCDYQWKLLEYEADRGIGTVRSIGLEMMTVAAACADSEIARDFFIATFQSELCRDHLRQNHTQRAMKIFKNQCPGWTEQQFVEAELLVMGLQYSTIVTKDTVVPLDVRISGALNQILSIYHIDKATRDKEIEYVLSMDCRGLGKRVFQGFIDYVEKNNEQILEELTHRKP